MLTKDKQVELLYLGALQFIKENRLTEDTRGRAMERALNHAQELLERTIEQIGDLDGEEEFPLAPRDTKLSLPVGTPGVKSPYTGRLDKEPPLCVNLTLLPSTARWLKDVMRNPLYADEAPLDARGREVIFTKLKELGV